MENPLKIICFCLHLKHHLDTLELHLAQRPKRKDHYGGSRGKNIPQIMTVLNLRSGSVVSLQALDR